MSKETFIYAIRPRRGFIDAMTPEEEDVMDRHFAYLQGFLAEGRLALTGPCQDVAFGIVIRQCPSQETAASLKHADPTVHAGLTAAELHRFRISLS